MSRRFEELDHSSTPMGEISLRRRLQAGTDVEVFEVLLGEEFLMSSLFTVAEVELARLGLAASHGEQLDVVVGGLGLGYTARAVLEDPRVRSLDVVEALEEVIGWHERGLLPGAAAMTGDRRCRLVRADFFAAVAEGTLATCDAILVDIDHSPAHVLHPSHAAFYTVDGLRRVRDALCPGGVFALWSDDPPDDAFVADLGQVFDVVQAHVVPFPNPYTGGEATNTVYVST